MSELRYWTAFYTKPRCEKKSASRLRDNGYEVYAPVRTTIKQWSDRKKKIQEPVFPSYIFAKVNEAERQQILFDPAISNSVFWLGKPVVIRQSEIEEIRAFLGKHPTAKTKAYLVRKGQDVSIKEGMLKGEKGTIKEVRNSRVVVQIESLGIQLYAELDPSTLKI